MTSNKELSREQLNNLTEQIIGCAYTVGNSLGCGFLEKVYENALIHELRKNGLNVEQQKSIKINYDGIVVGDYVADLIVDNSVLVELKAVRVVDETHLAQCMNYLKATGIRICLLINFGTTKVKIKRIVNKY
ncbi:MAG: GxxExxY protein [Planctomycetota bacterium]|jgi:GxxExxY protein